MIKPAGYDKKLRYALEVLDIISEDTFDGSTDTVSFNFEGAKYCISVDTFYTLLDIIDEYGKQPTPREFEEMYQCPKN